GRTGDVHGTGERRCHTAADDNLPDETIAGIRNEDIRGITRYSRWVVEFGRSSGRVHKSWCRHTGERRDVDTINKGNTTHFVIALVTHVKTRSVGCEAVRKVEPRARAGRISDASGN